MGRQLQDAYGCVRPLSVITPIARGGTAADNAPQAVINLGGIARTTIDQPLGVAGADQQGYLDRKYLDNAGIFSGIMLEGPRFLVRSNNDYTFHPFFFISNLHTPAVPEIVTHDALVESTLSIDWPNFSFQTPSAGEDVTLTINARDYVFPMFDDMVLQPRVLLGPDARLPNSTVLRSSKFTSLGEGNIHTSDSWNTLGLGEVLIPIDAADRSVVFRGRAGEHGLVQITDGENVFTFPVSQAMLVLRPEKPVTYKVLVAGEAVLDYVVSKNTLTHTVSYWEVATDAEFTDVVYSKNATIIELVELPIVLTDGAYFVRVRHVAGMLMSDWSEAAQFTIDSELNTLTDYGISIDQFPVLGGAYGTSVASSDSGLVAVGSPHDGRTNQDAGVVTLYKRQGYTSHYFNRIMSVLHSASSLFGMAVSFNDNDSLYVGAPGVNGEGVVYRFDKSGDDYVFNEQIDARPGSVGFGYSVKVTDNRLFIGDPLSAVNGVNAGAVHVYSLENGATTFIETIYPETPSADAYFGISLEADPASDLLFIGATSAGDDFTDGKFYLFSKNGNSYEETTIRNSPMPEAGYGFGRSICYDKEKGNLFIGCDRDADKGMNAGAVYRFTVTLAPSLELAYTGKLYAQNGVTNGRFGSGLAATKDGYSLFIGSPGYQLGNSSVGALYYFT